MGSKVPFRIELFDEEIESIRTFDPETQRSLENRPDSIIPGTGISVTMSPSSIFARHSEPLSRKFRQKYLYVDVSKGIAPKRH